MHLRSKGFWSQVVAAAMLMLFPDAAAVWAQQAAKPAPSTQQQSIHSQQPPSLTVDRDPVASPDADAPAKSATEPPQGIGLGPVGRGAGGKYTLRTDAYE